MDFGLGESLKMFEGHFGPKWSKALIGLIALAVVGFCIHAIIEYMIFPIYHVILWVIEYRNLNNIDIHSIIRHLLSAVCALLLTYFIATRLLKFHMGNNKARLHIARAIQSFRHYEDMAQTNTRLAELNPKRIEMLREEFLKEAEEALKELNQIHEKAKKIRLFK